MSFAALYGFGWNDYSVEVTPAYGALTSGHVWTFLSLAPAYGGSLELRAPFALLPGLWGGGDVAVYRSVSIACLLAAALFAVWLVGADARARPGPPRRAPPRSGLCVANPVTLLRAPARPRRGAPRRGAVRRRGARRAARPRRLGGGAARPRDRQQAVGAARRRPGARRAPRAARCARWRTPGRSPSRSTCRCCCRLVGGGGAAGAGGLGGAAIAQTGSGTIFQPWQLWWFLGSHGHTVLGSFGAVKPGYRTPPGWIGGVPTR